jgi:formate hydrogenlyase transcriptional activator
LINKQLQKEIARRKQAEESLRERLEFEALLSNLSARFVNLPPEVVDREIELALKDILDFLKVDRAGLIRTSKNKESFQITHVAYSGDVSPVPGLLIGSAKGNFGSTSNGLVQMGRFME